MKRIALLLTLIYCVLLGLNACAIPPTNLQSTMPTATTGGDVADLTTVPTAPTNPTQIPTLPKSTEATNPTEEADRTYNPTTANSYSEYLEKMPSYDIPELFVTYEQLSQLFSGDFGGFSFNLGREFKEYGYGFLRFGKCLTTVNLIHNQPPQNWFWGPELPVSAAYNHFFYVDAPENPRYEIFRNGVYYQYGHNRLVKIEIFLEDGRWIIIEFDRNYLDYYLPTSEHYDPTDIVSQLRLEDDAGFEAALEKIEAVLGGKIIREYYRAVYE